MIGVCSGLSLIVGALNGCGGPSDPIEVSEAAKTYLAKKKADYQHRSTKSTRTGPSNPKTPTAGPRP